MLRVQIVVFSILIFTGPLSFRATDTKSSKQGKFVDKSNVIVYRMWKPFKEKGLRLYIMYKIKSIIEKY